MGSLPTEYEYLDTTKLRIIFNKPTKNFDFFTSLCNTYQIYKFKTSKGLFICIIVA